MSNTAANGIPFQYPFKYDVICFIGRFEPWHIGHDEVARRALTLAKRVVILVGSSFQARTIKNPWRYHERVQMISAHLESIEDPIFREQNSKQRVRFAPVRDNLYNDQAWAMGVQNAVSEVIDSIGFENPKIGIIGHSKDETSYYLKMFPQWGTPIEHELNEKVNATDLRELLFEGLNTRYLQSLLPPAVYEFIKDFTKTGDYATLVEEYQHIKKYKAQWAAAPYPPTFVTADAVVVQSGHILLVERGHSPGKGLYALPGGFVGEERVVKAAIRELREETRLKVPEPVLYGNIVSTEVCDHPKRSLRGRTITHAVHIELPPGPLPVVKGSDDARRAFWIPLSEVPEDMMFEDHFFIIQHFLG